MSYVTYRAEQALISALLNEPTPGNPTYIAADDFGHPTHKATYIELALLRETHPGMRGEALADAITDRLRDAGQPTTAIDSARRMHADPAHAPAYAQLVMAAGLHRDVSRAAVDIAQGAMTGQRDRATRELATALAQRATAYAALAAASPEPGAIPIATDTQPDPRRDREDEVLADLIQHPERAREVGRFLEPDNFTTHQRQQVYTTVVELAFNDVAVDGTIVAWQLENQRSWDALNSIERPAPATEPDLVYINRLSTMDVTPGASIIIGRELLAEDLHKNLTNRTSTLGAATKQAKILPQPASRRTPVIDATMQRPEPRSEPGNTPRIER